MSKSVSHYLRDYLKLTDSAKFNLIGGAERDLTDPEKLNMDATVLKFLKLKVPAPGPNDVFIYEIKSAADFTAAPVAGYANYAAFIQDFKDVQKAIVQKFLKDADDAAAPPPPAGAAPAGAASPFMGGRRSKQYGGNPAAIPHLKKGSAVAGVVAAGDPISAIGFISNPLLDKLADLLRGNLADISEADIFSLTPEALFLDEIDKLIPYMITTYPVFDERVKILNSLAVNVKNPDPTNPAGLSAEGIRIANLLATAVKNSHTALAP